MRPDSVHPAIDGQRRTQENKQLCKFESSQAAQVGDSTIVPVGSRLTASNSPSAPHRFWRNSRRSSVAGPLQGQHPSRVGAPTTVSTDGL